MNKLILSLFLLLFAAFLFSQKKEFSVSGFVTDSKTGEALLGSNILLYKDSLNLSGNPLRGTSTNNFGFYVLPDLSPARYIIIFRHIGYKPVVIDSALNDINAIYRINIALQSEEIQLEEVVVQGKREVKMEVSVIEISPDIINKLPSLSGEADLLKSLEYIPGVKSASEISSGLYIRGGSPDQTLTLVDGMIFYYPAHLGNFTTTFNSSALQEIKLFKGAFPAEYGGRLSGVLDLKLRSGTKERDIGSVGIGTLNSNLTLEGPLNSNSSYMIAGRGMYYDILQKNFDKDSKIPRYHFYDMNCKFSYTFSGSNIVSISALYSKDRLYNPPGSEDIRYDINWQNSGLNINWFEVNSSSLISNTTASYINYIFGSSVENNSSVSNSSDYFTLSKLQDFLLIKSFEFYLYEKHSIKAGAELNFHRYSLLHNDFYDPRLETNNELSNDVTSLESALFLQDNAKITSNFSANIGGRLYYFEETNYFSVEPRISLSYSPLINITLKCGYGLTEQFLHLITRNDISLPTDLWYPSSKKIKPERSNEYVLGIDMNFLYPEYFFSCEGYYRDMKNLLEFNEKADFNVNEPIEEILTSGEGESYGLEFFLNKRTGDINGWVGYTLSWTKRLFSEINANRIFYPKYDRRHDLSLILTYNPTPFLSLGMTWIYATGAGITLPLGQYQLYNSGLNNDPSVRVNYSDRNGYKLPDYHKMDLNISYKFSWLNLPFQVYLNIYNLYNHKNSFAQYVSKEKDSENPEKIKLKLKQITLFPFIPTAGVNINF